MDWGNVSSPKTYQLNAFFFAKSKIDGVKRKIDPQGSHSEDIMHIKVCVLQDCIISQVDICLT